MLIHPDRLFPAERHTRELARALYEHVRKMPIVSPHGHTKAEWFARNEPFPDPAQFIVQPDHYICRMLYSQGVALEDLEIGFREPRDPRRCGGFLPSTTISFPGYADSHLARSDI